VTHQKEIEVDKFLEFFYAKYCVKLFAPIAQLTMTPGSHDTLNLGKHSVGLYAHLCELLCFNINQHAMFCKNFLLNHDGILRSVSLLLNAKQTHLRLGILIKITTASLRVFRTCIGTKDEFYRRLLLKQDAFGPIFTVLLSTEGRANLLNSACLEFFEFIKKV
jgi:protein phosphatase 4 regulatory subunit 3